MEQGLHVTLKIRLSNKRRHLVVFEKGRVDDFMEQMVQVVIYALYGFIVTLGRLNGSKWLT